MGGCRGEGQICVYLKIQRYGEGDRVGRDREQALSVVLFVLVLVSKEPCRKKGEINGRDSHGLWIF